MKNYINVSDFREVAKKKIPKNVITIEKIAELPKIIQSINQDRK